jgi:HEPN domain-containing protein
MNSKIKYWIDISDYDIETAKAMLKTERMLYVGFMCHQSIEKILKAYWEKTKNDHPPKTHNLTRLSYDTELESLMGIDQIELLSELEPLQIESRYPSYKDQLLNSLTREYSEDLIKRTGELQQWIKMKL